MIDLILGLIIGKLVFDIPFRGSLVLLFGAAAIYLVVTLGDWTLHLDRWTPSSRRCSSPFSS